MAFNIQVPQFVIDVSEKFVNENNLGARKDNSNGTKDQQLIGVIGQNMMALALGKPFMEPSNTHDGGVDFEIFGVKLDIKTMGRTVEPKLDYINNLIGSQIKYNVNAYVFCSLNTSNCKLTVCGWIPKDIFLQKAEFFAKGTTRQRTNNTSFEFKTDNYEIKNQDLYYRPKNWAELFVNIYQNFHNE